jgi:alpha-galactosidase
LVHGVVAADRSEAVFACPRLRSGPSLHTAPIRPVGLDEATTYDISIVPIGRTELGRARQQPSWLSDGLAMTGRQLSAVGFSAPVLHPETSILLHITTAEG